MSCLRAGAAAAAIVFAAGCATGQSAAPPPSQRLVDLFTIESLAGSAVPVGAAAEPIRWKFDAPIPAERPFAKTGGCEAGPGVAGLTVREGHLVGRATSDHPILHLPAAEKLTSADPLHAVEVRMKSSQPGTIAVSWARHGPLDLQHELDEARDFNWKPQIPLISDGTMHTYTMTPQFPVAIRDVQDLLVRPTDAPGAEFEIESVRLVSRSEHLARVPSGPGWQGLGEIYMETLVSRTPESLRFTVTLPEKPWLDLSVGTYEDHPVTFHVTAGAGGSESPVLTRTVTRPHAWDSAPVDLAPWAGKTVTLALTLESDGAGRVGLWGAPVVRSHAGSALAAGGKPGAPRGVILVWADTLRRDHLDFYGYERMTAPHLSAMGAEGTIFDDCVSQATWTKVATPSMMTSLPPLSTGVRTFYDRLPASATTMAEVFREAGAATLSMSSVLFTGKMTNLHQGFEALHEDASLPNRQSSKTAREYVDRLIPWLEAHRDVPFFVFLHVTDPHDPFRPEPPWDTLWTTAERSKEHVKDVETIPKFIKDPLLKVFKMPTRAEVAASGLDPDAYSQADQAWYDGSIRGMDEELGRLMERLGSMGIADSTLFVFTGDHGEEFFEHGRSFHGQSVYGEQHRVPLLFRLPGLVAAGSRFAATVQSVDIMPTILDLCGLMAPEGLAGVSHAAALRNPQGAPEGDALPAFTEKAATKAGDGSPPLHQTESYSVVAGGWHLIRNIVADPARPMPEFELYDRKADPHEQANIAADHPDVVARLAPQIEAWRTKSLAAKVKGDDQAAEALKPEELERLRSLGYLP